MSSMSYRTEGACPDQILTHSARFKCGPGTKFGFYVAERYRVKMRVMKPLSQLGKQQSWLCGNTPRSASPAGTDTGNAVAKQKTGQL